MFPINKILHISAPIIIYTILVYVPKSSAEKVTVENILDLSVFGPCNINLKWFREHQLTVDLIEEIVLVQQKLRKDYSLTTIDNATRRVPMVSPTIGLFEGCVLNIIVGLGPNDGIRQDQFMMQNNYTYSSTPFSTYILIPYTYKANENVIPPKFAMLYLPVRVFYLLVPILPDDDVNLYTRPYVLVCAPCGKSWAKKMAGSSDLAYLSSLNFSTSWLRNNVQIINRYFEGDITGCDYAPWVGLGLTKCTHNFPFMDVLVRSIELNLTLSANYNRHNWDNRSLGHIENGYLRNQHFEAAASSFFHDSAIGVIYFCDCNPKSQTEMLTAWGAPFGRFVWVGLVITFLLLSIMIGIKLKVCKGDAKTCSVKDCIVPLFTVAGLYLRQQGTKVGNQGLVILSSFCIGVVLSLYENAVTSKLVVPPPKFEHNLSSLLMSAGTKIIYTGLNTSRNGNLMELQFQTTKYDIQYAKERFELNNELYNKALPLENQTSRAYLGFYTAVENDQRLRQLKIMNNKCHCYLVKHTFRKTGHYIHFDLLLKKRFISILNVLRQSGITYFFNEKYRKHEGYLLLAKLRRLLEDKKLHSDFFAREEPGPDLIQLGNLYFLLVIFGGMGFVAVIIFTLTEMDWVTLHNRCQFLAWKCLHAIRSVNYVRLANRLCTFRLLRRTSRTLANGGSILKRYSWRKMYVSRQVDRSLF
jgi:hypothetical protein